MRIATILFCHNRTKYLKDIFNKVGKIDYAFIDFSDKQEEVAAVLQGNVNRIIKRVNHLGLASNIISGVTEVFCFCDAVIVIEDDLLLDKKFIGFMTDNLIKYADAKYIGSVTGYYDSNHHCCKSSSWGWGTWKKVWQSVNWDYEDVDNGFGSIRSDFPNMYRKAKEGLIDSWAIRFAYHHYKNNLIGYHPKKSLTKHVGVKGTHSNFLSKFGVRQYFR